jgi:ribosomal protein L11 methyltransferase
MRRWQELCVEIPPEAGDALSSWLVDQGAPGVIEEEAGDRLRLRAHFANGDGGGLLRAVQMFLDELEEFFPGAGAAIVAIGVIDEEDWADGWKQSFPCMEIGRRLRVRPPWAPRGSTDRHDIEIMPAMAFGTGQHASTLGCLLAIEELFEAEGALSPVLDVGTGSGILAVTAARLGARRIVALDTDPIALAAAADNVRRNGVDRVVRLQPGSIDVLEERFALIVANLHSAVLGTMFGSFRAHTTARAWLVVSGLLDADRDGIHGAGLAAGWLPAAERSLDGWATLVFRSGD